MLKSDSTPSKAEKCRGNDSKCTAYVSSCSSNSQGKSFRYTIN